MSQTALITGSAKRVGREVALHLASKGWDIALHYNSSEKAANKLITELQKKYPEQKFVLFQSNMQNPFAVESLIPEVLKVFGQLDLLVNNASVFEGASIFETHFDFLDRVMMINYRAPFMLIRDLARHVGKGVVVNFVDTRITSSKSDYAAYSLSKKALWELSKMAALEFAPYIRVNAIAPGATLPPEDKDESYLWLIAKKTPMQKPSGIDPILKSLDYILENDHLTGQLLFCDGGENLGQTF
ncbi:SDR family NAD(P)-dependent oxidoreductase [Mangrovibacterium sp.]|uniref:SDR family NAD(P)-dependent oxidoreductase n=1 Tax=Mangrovibacterium sp. TaxID=1961364 RepID=UPI003565A974